ncbi:MAG: cardiolipin synthase [Enterobacteriaceae bacterium PC38]|nr:MAG: cardiolipin synthase [Enterobacteriaceae bacterium PC38]
MQLNNFNLQILLIFLIIILIIEFILIKFIYKIHIILLLFYIYILPILSIFFFILTVELSLGKLRTKRIKFTKSFINNIIKQIKKKQKKSYNQKYTVTIKLFKFLIKQNNINSINTFFKKSDFKIFSNNKKILKKIIYDIKKAKYKIEMIFYIWKQGGIVNKIIESLINASKRGICCRIILDSVGCFSFLKSKYIILMKKAGIKIIKAFKLNMFDFLVRRIDIRQHKKIILIDNYIVYTGSMNMIDINFNINKKYIDIMIRFTGIISNIISIIYDLEFEMETGEKIIFKKKYKKIKRTYYHKKNQNFHIISSIPYISNKLIHKVFLKALHSAKKKIVITTPYFIPTNKLIKEICNASLRGVKVIIIIPKKNDSLMVLWASKYFYIDLLKSGVKIYEFKNNLLHTKSLLIDDKVSIIGTVNFDIRSFFLNSEITLIIEDNNFSNIISQIQKTYIKKSKLIKFKKWKKRSYFNKLFEFFFFIFNPIL